MKFRGNWVLRNPIELAVTSNHTNWVVRRRIHSRHVYKISTIIIIIILIVVAVAVVVKVGRDKIGVGDRGVPGFVNAPES